MKKGASFDIFFKTIIFVPALALIFYVGAIIWQNIVTQSIKKDLKDGKGKILFYNRDSYTEIRNHIAHSRTIEEDYYFINPDGSNKIRLHMLDLNSPIVSPKYNKIAWLLGAGGGVRNHGKGICITDINLKNRKILDECSAYMEEYDLNWPPYYHTVRWSKDGRELLYYYNDGKKKDAEKTDWRQYQYEVNIENGQKTMLRLLTFDEFQDEDITHGPYHSPDGQKVFQKKHIKDMGSGHEIYLDAYNDKITSGTKVSWSPDSEKLAFIGGKEDWDIYIADIKTAKVKKLTNHIYWGDSKFAGGYYLPSWSPDSRYICCGYSRGVGSILAPQSGIYIIDTISGNKFRLAEGHFPVWLPE